MAGERILIVEDNVATEARPLEIQLNTAGYNVVGIAATEEAAVALACREHPAVVLMDIELEDEDGNKDRFAGLRAARRIQAATKAQIIFVTGILVDKHIISEARKTHDCQFLIKPIQERQLLVSVQIALAMAAGRHGIFVCYSSGDRRFADELMGYRELQEEKIAWVDTQVHGSENWKEDFERTLSRAKAAICLVSTDFILSQYVNQKQMPLLRKVADEHGLLVIPVYVKRVQRADLEPLGLLDFPGINEPENPIDRWTKPKRYRDCWSVLCQRLEPEASETGEGQPPPSPIVASPASPPPTRPVPRSSPPPVQTPPNDPHSSDERIGAMPTLVAPPRVFISYSHDSQEHRDRVLELAQRLRRNGLDAWLDRFEPAPAEGWPRWMLHQIEEAAFVLLIGTPTYKRRFEGKEQHGVGRGVSWEGWLATQLIYEASGHNPKLIPAFYEGPVEECLPLSLRPYKSYHLPDDYPALLARLLQQPEVSPIPLGPLPPLAPKSEGSITSGTLYPTLEIRVDGKVAAVRRHITEIEGQLKKLVGGELYLVGVEEGSAVLLVAGPPETLDKLSRMIDRGVVKTLAGLKVLSGSRIEGETQQRLPWLDNAMLMCVFDASDKLGLGENGWRRTLLSGLPSRIRDTMPPAPAPTGAAQLLLDLRFLNGQDRLSDGTIPLKAWLETAALLNKDFEAVQVFRSAIARLD